MEHSRTHFWMNQGFALVFVAIIQTSVRQLELEIDTRCSKIRWVGIGMSIVYGLLN